MTDQGEPVDVVHLDFSKAFDSVCHRLPDGSNGDQPQKNTLGGAVPKEQDISSEIGRPPLERRYRKKRLAPELCAWAPSIPDIYK